jgi:MFS family permease
MWTWFAVFMGDTLARHGSAAPQRGASLAAFAVIGAGAAGCWAAGRMGDRWGRTRTTALAMALSGGCSLLIGWEGLPVSVVVALGLVWGFWVVADLAQFSTMVTEVAEQRYVGTAVTLQLAIGFTLTVATIWLVPVLRDLAGWHGAFASLAAGPLVGVAAMLRLKRSPAARQIAGGRG